MSDYFNKKKTLKQKIIAPCGIDCFNCELYNENVTDELQKHISESTKIPKELISCKGCIDGNICLFLRMQGQSCKTHDCVNSKGISYCFECTDFPCSYLMPLADGANKYPHNIKLYNLCLMKKLGVEEWIKHAGDIKRTYFTKKMAIGEGGSN